MATRNQSAPQPLRPQDIQTVARNEAQSASSVNSVRRKVAKNKRNYSSANAWLSEIKSRQQQFVTPELRQQMKKKAARSRKLGKMKKRAKVYQRAAVMSKSAWAQGNVRSAASAPMRRQEAALVSNQQMLQIQEVYNHRRFDEESDCEEELELALDTLEVEQRNDVIQVDENDMGRVLAQLRVEPKEESEVSAKFELYSEFLKTVEASRKATFDFWKDCKEEFTQSSGVGNAVPQVEQDLKNIDKEENLGIQFHEHRWFVYDMTQKADSNNENIKGVLKNIETKIELLKNDDDCPFCLEALDSLPPDQVHTLGCCHKACTDCWTNWTNLKGRQAFCPLCRQTDFLGEMC